METTETAERVAERLYNKHWPFVRYVTPRPNGDIVVDFTTKKEEKCSEISDDLNSKGFYWSEINEKEDGDRVRFEEI